MSEDIIKKLAVIFREAIECAIECGAITTRTTKTTLPYFPKGCCEIASDLLAQFFLENNIASQCVHGEYCFDYETNKYPHNWLETKEGYIVDITSDQFRNMPGFDDFVLPSCYVSKDRTLHNLFNERMYNDGFFCGLDSYNDEYKKKLEPLYEVILRFIK